MHTSAKWIAALATLGVAGSLSGVASGVGFVHVKLLVPKKPVPIRDEFDLGVKGHSSKPTKLDVFWSNHPCKPNAELETALVQEKKQTVRAIHHPKIHGDFTYHTSIISALGKHYACAYLYEVPKTTLARDEASWHTIPGGA